MTAPEADLTGWTASPFSAAGYTYDVYRKGEGPGVVSLTASLEAPTLQPEIVHMLYWLGWMIIDLAYMVTTFQIFAVSIVFLRDTREKPLVPAWVNWWGFVTCAAFFPVSLIPRNRSAREAHRAQLKSLSPI